MADSADSPRVLWTPSEEDVAASNVARFISWVESRHGLRFANYDQLWQWSVDRLEDFWAAVWDFYDVQASQQPSNVLSGRSMPGARWFEGAELNYAQHVLRAGASSEPALIVVREDADDYEISWSDLRAAVSAFARDLREAGVTRGDRVVGYLPNIPEAVVAMLATTSLGAVWAACATDLGAQAVLDRFGQLSPKILVASESHRFGGRSHDRREVVLALQAGLPTLEQTMVVKPGQVAQMTDATRSTELQDPSEFAQVPFDHPLWILFSSGTTGIPKGIVQSHGGILLEHLKSLGLCLDLRPDDRYFFYSSTSWMVWNYLVGGLLHGSTVVLFEGSPSYPRPDALWEHAARVGATVLGMGSAYVMGNQKAKARVGQTHDLRALRTVVPTGSPLSPPGWRWLDDELPSRTRIDSICGGTDVCTAFIGGSPMLPVYSGEISCRWLGVKAESFGPDAKPQVGSVGEFVITEPMPSMPVMLWNDTEDVRYRDAYFSTFPGVWRQGDWVTLTERGTLVVAGRSDATLNRSGVRIGSAEIYAVVERLEGVLDSLVVGIERPDSGYYMPLFVVLEEGVDEESLTTELKSAIRRDLSPRHLPDEIVVVPAVPRTLTGKKLEVPVKRLLAGEPLEQVAAVGAADPPGSLEWFQRFAEDRRVLLFS